MTPARARLQRVRQFLQRTPQSVIFNSTLNKTGLALPLSTISSKTTPFPFIPEIYKQNPLTIQKQNKIPGTSLRPGDFSIHFSILHFTFCILHFE
jgi:hypothetical protein